MIEIHQLVDRRAYLTPKTRQMEAPQVYETGTE